MNWTTLKIRYTAWLKRKVRCVKCWFLGHDTSVKYSRSGRAKARSVRYDGVGDVRYSCYRCQTWVLEDNAHETNTQNHQN